MEITKLNINLDNYEIDDNVQTIDIFDEIEVDAVMQVNGTLIVTYDIHTREYAREETEYDKKIIDVTMTIDNVTDFEGNTVEIDYYEIQQLIQKSIKL